MQVTQQGEGLTPDLLRLVAQSPPTKELLRLGLQAASQVHLTPRVRTAIALRVAELHGCVQSLASLVAAAIKDGIDSDEVSRFRLGASADPKEQALLALASKVTREHGRHAGFVVETALRLGVTETEIVEVVALIAVHTLINYLTSAAQADMRARADGVGCRGE